MKKCVTFIIPDRRPPNGQKTYSGINHFARAKMALEWGEIVQQAMKASKIESCLMQQCEFSMLAFMRRPMFDCDNISPKCLIDGMKRWRTTRKKKSTILKGDPFTVIRESSKTENNRYLFEDDSWPHIISVQTKIIPADQDRIEIYVVGEI